MGFYHLHISAILTVVKFFSIVSTSSTVIAFDATSISFTLFKLTQTRNGVHKNKAFIFLSNIISLEK